MKCASRCLQKWKRNCLRTANPKTVPFTITLPMLEAYLTLSPDFNDLLHYCNVIYDMLPTILMSSTFRNDKDARRLSAIALVACGYGGDMPESLSNELLDDIDFYYNKVKCRKIERMLPALSKMVIEEQNDFAKQHPGVL